MTEVWWSYDHRDLGEPALPDGSRVCRRVVPLIVAPFSEDLLAVVDSGSPISVAEWQLFKWLGVDISRVRPLYEVPLGLGSGVGMVPVFEVELALRPPNDIDHNPVAWKLHLGARANWRLPFAVLFGQRGWFERFLTTIDSDSTVVRLS